MSKFTIKKLNRVKNETMDFKDVFERIEAIKNRMRCVFFANSD